MKCKHCGNEIIEPKLKFRRFKCLPNIEVSEIIDWDKPYNEIEVPKGCRLIKVQEIIILLESNEEDKFLGKYKSKFNFFWIAQRKGDKLNKKSCRVSRFSDGWGASWGILGDSNRNGRVVFVKDVKERK